MGVSHPFCMGDWGLFVNAYYAKMLNLAALKEVASFYESMSLFGFFSPLQNNSVRGFIYASRGAVDTEFGHRYRSKYRISDCESKSDLISVQGQTL